MPAVSRPKKPPAPGDFDRVDDAHWSNVGTIDNDATVTEIRYLALVVAALPGEAGEMYRRGAERGVRYLLAAQFPNGGWPQVRPLQGAITTPSR